MNKKTALIMLIAGILIAYLSLPFLYLSFPDKIKKYVYRELMYVTISDRLFEKSKSVPDFLQNTLNYVTLNIDSAHGPPAMDDNVWRCFVRGFGYCDQQVWAFSTLLAKRDIPSRLVMLKGVKPGRHGLDGHSVAEVYLDNDWRIISVQRNIIFYNKKGGLATFDEIYKDRTILDPISGKVPDFDLYKSFFDKTYEPERWEPLTSKQDIVRQAVFSPVYIYYKAFGKRFSKFYQDLYLRGRGADERRRHRYLIREALE
ncbi:MAG: hypothetical protein A2987_00665 [Omnitrophica bacterium RIFCSPLOWO2_01_FULL_45_10]|nr:MAG: hypothetical protein A2987_00665 [Omnitrophica bacterium RIFCSPLOWO2_01_FULL_45_10]